MSSTRREVLYQIAVSAAGAAAPPLAAQQHPPHPAPAKPAASRRRVFNEHEFNTLRSLSNWIIPPDDRSAGGIEAGTAEFIDVIAASDPGLQAAFTGGLAWLDQQMRKRYHKGFLESAPAQQKEMLDQIAHRGRAGPEMAPGVAFFALMRSWTVDAFYSSKAGVQDLGYMGNTAVAEFHGCPEEVVKKLLDASPA